MKEESKIKLKIGDIVTTITGEFKIMAIADGYVMMRRKGCVPIIERLKTLEKTLIVNHE